jgi:hypothetical protein
MFPPSPDAELTTFAPETTLASSARLPPGVQVRPAPADSSRPPSYKPGLPTVLEDDGREDDGRDSEEELAAELETSS